MNPVIAALLVGVLTTIGRWSRGKGMTVDVVVGVVGVAIGLAIIDQMNKQFARAFGALIVIGVAVAHLPNIVSAAGPTLSGKRRPTAPQNLPGVGRPSPGQSQTLPGVGRPRPGG